MAGAGPHPASAVVQALWRDAGLPEAALGHVALPGDEPALPSSFAVGTAAQASLAAAALAAAELWHARSGAARQTVSVDKRHAAVECCGHFTLDGRVPNVWDKLSGLYPCGGTRRPGWVRLHANFAHHRDRALASLGCATGPGTDRAAVIEALRGWAAEDFETAAAQAGAVATAVRDFDTWDRHPQARAVGSEPLVHIEAIGASGTSGGTPNDIPGGAPALPWPALRPSQRPLHGLRVLDLTRILAGPVAGRTLAAYGADVMLLNSPSLPNIEAIADTSRGKRSAHVDLKTAAGCDSLRALVRESHVFLQAYRPGALAELGFGAQELAAIRPGIVVVSLSAWGTGGPWAQRRGFDSLVQTATGFNAAEAQAFGAAQPKPLPMQILDYAAGYLLAFGAQAALWRQAQQGGSWHVQMSLAGVGRWLRSLGRVDAGPSITMPSFEPWLDTFASGYGELVAPRHAAQFSATPPRWDRPAMPPGSHPAAWN